MKTAKHMLHAPVKRKDACYRAPALEAAVAKGNIGFLL